MLLNVFGNSFFQGASPVAQRAKNLPAMQETQVRSMGQEDPLEKGMATYPSILAWKIPWTEEASGGYGSWGCKESDTAGVTNTFNFFHTSKGVSVR